MNEPVPSLDHGGPEGHPFVPMGPELLDRSVFAVFAEVAARHAGKTAVRDAAGSVSYGELLERVTALAALLADHGERGEPVGIALPVGSGIPAAMLACLAAGRPYVPLDLRHPAERRSTILRHARCRTMLVAGETVGDPGSCRAELIDVRGVASAPASWKPSAVPDDLAYVLYTSGSTGSPKGVVQDQRGLLHDVLQYTNSVHLSATDVCSLFYSPSVNGAIRDIYGALLNGAELCMTDLLGEGFAEALGRTGGAGMTVFHAMPPVLRSLLRVDGVEGLLRRVRLAYVAGDRFFGSDLQLLRRVMPADAFVYTGIGSTECATLYRQWFVPRDWEAGAGAVVPVGYAVADRRVLLRDADGGPVAPGERGEIRVQSRHVARGYWREPELTAAAFLDLGDGVREFRTGDCGVLRADGLLEFGGRGDRQIKVRGFRVEPGEVEAQLRAMDGVREAAVAVSESGRLLAFVEMAAGEHHGIPGGDALREGLRERLPGHLVPEKVNVLARLPRLANLKVDYAALQPLACAEVLQDDAGNPATTVPTTPAPERSTDWLAVAMEAWKQSCGRTPPRATAPWQEAGGDSIQALELLVTLERRAGRKLPTSTVGPAATPESMARQLAGTAEEASERPDRRLPGTFWLVTWAPVATLQDRWLVDQLSDLVSAAVLELTTVDEELERMRTIPQLAEECAHRIARGAPPGSDVYLMGISFGSRVAMELGSVLLRRGYAVRYVGVCDIAPMSGYDALARGAEAVQLSRIGNASWPKKLQARLLAEARWWMSRRVQWMARHGWQRGVRATAWIGQRLLGPKFSNGVKGAIRRAQASLWQPSWYHGELTLLLTGKTVALFPGASATLGWEHHAASVRCVIMPGDHYTYNCGAFADGFAQLVRSQVTAAAAPRNPEDSL